MSELEPVPELPEELQGLLQAERARPDPTRDLRTQLWGGIAAGLATAPPPPVVPKPLAPAMKAAAAKLGLGKALVIGAVAFGVGAGSGVVVDRKLLRGPAPAEIEAAPVPAPELPAIPEIAEPSPVARPKPTPRAAAKPSESHDGALAAERALLERARTALARGRASEAYQAALEHEMSYPHGQLVEERQVLEVQSLVALGRRSEAVQAAAAFRRSHPKSLLLPALDDALGGHQ